MGARPILRWAGGKQRWLNSHSAAIPRFTGQYLEPFFGGGSVFFFVVRREIRPFEAWLGDANQQLIKTYIAIRDHVDDVVESVEVMQVAYRKAADKRLFYESVRQDFNDALPRVSPEKFLFLNATCWNGLWRTNASGRFNVPFGALKSDDVMPSPASLRAVSSALQRSRLRASTWENIVGAAAPGDFVFLDPPYFSDVASGGPAKYGPDHFTLADHEALARAAADLQRRSISFVLTNSAEPEMVDLYSGLGLNVQRVMVPRAINSRTDSRQPVGELIVTNASETLSELAARGVLLDLDVLRRTPKNSRP